MVLLRTACLHSQTSSTKEKGPQPTVTTRSPFRHTTSYHILRAWHSSSPPTNEQTPFTFHSRCFSNSNQLLKSRTTPHLWWPTTGRERRPEHRPCTRPATPYPASLSQLYSLQSVVVPYFCLDPIFVAQLLTTPSFPPSHYPSAPHPNLIFATAFPRGWRGL